MPKHPKADDVVLYTCGDFSHPAIVLSARFGETTHLGSDGEPLLHLAFIAPERESPTTKFANAAKPELGYKAGYIPSIHMEYDVVHDSHEFDAVARKKLGLTANSTPAEIAARRGQGSWKLMDEPDGNVATKAAPQADEKPAKVWGSKKVQ